jgi:hypothetical protein
MDGLRRRCNRGSRVFRSGNTIPHIPTLIIASGEAAAFISTTFLVPFSSFFPKSTVVMCLHPAHDKNWFFLLHIVDSSLAVDVTKCAQKVIRSINRISLSQASQNSQGQVVEIQVSISCTTPSNVHLWDYSGGNH